MKWIRTVIATGLVFFAVDAMAQNCTLSTVPVSFGDYDVASPAPVVATGEVSVTCDSGVPYTVRLDQGQNSAGSFFPRRMAPVTGPGASALEYNLYRNSSMTEVLGDGTNSTFTLTAAGTGNEERFTIYGRVPALQDMPDGMYTDVVTVIIEW